MESVEGRIEELLSEWANLKPAVTKVLFPKRQLSARFQSLVSHYLFEPCFARPGEGHDKGGVESRGNNVRQQQLTPIPRGQTLAEIAGDLMASLDRDATLAKALASEA